MYILIVITTLTNGHHNIALQDFSNKQTCESAARVIQVSVRDGITNEPPQALCVVK